ncbi:HNH endonuclease [Limibacter armeniacum]|uniref:HNH endonuclease n=1 Tax=Limibacter armeniacum TaxID=466084 RepID=UPI002FE5C058
MSLATKKVLVLNADFQAFGVCNVYRAFLLVFMNKAEIIIPAENITLCTVNRAYSVPSVIKLNRYINIPYKGVMMSRQNIFKRDNFSCLYCGSKNNLTLDHVIPRSRGGQSTWKNLVTACKSCNSKKGDRTPDEALMDLAYQPFKPSFVLFLKNFSGLNEESWRPYLEVGVH